MVASSAFPRAGALIARALLGFLALSGHRSLAADAGDAPLLGVVRQTEIRIAPETSARLISVRVQPGQAVHKGDILAVLSSPELTAGVEEAKAGAASSRADKANVDAGVRKEEVDIAAENVRIAQANLVLAQQQHVRAATLAAREFASKQQLDEATASLSNAEASVSLAEANYAQSKAGPTKEERAIAAANVALAEAAVLDIEAQLAKTTLVAPIDGTVGLIVAELGEAISPGQTVMTLEAGHERFFTFTIREDRLSGITMGAKLTLVSAKGDHIEARVTELRPLGEFAVWRAARAVGDHDINSFLMRADPIAEAAGLEPGMSVWIDRESRPR